MLFSPPESSSVSSLPARAPTHGQQDHSLPLAGIVVCCTSIPDEMRTSLAAQAEQMGAIHRYDLTLDVTHLIIGNRDTEKYRYVARERPDVRPMTVAWIEAIRELWINDKEIQMEELEKTYTLPTLHSLKLSMTGCDDPSERASIADQVKSNGAVYEGDLTKHITHLISFRTEGAKYKAAKSWGIKTVSIEWLAHSLERGMILNEELYDPTLPVSERGKGAWDRTKPRRTSLGKRQREVSNTHAEGGKKKLRRTASLKFNSQSDQIWDDIVGGASNVLQVNRSGQWEPTGEGALAENATSKAPKTDPVAVGRRSSNAENPRPEGMFSGHYFHYYGFSPQQAQIVGDHLLSHGAQLAASLKDLVSSAHDNSSRLFVIIPHDLPRSEHHDLPSSLKPIETVTVWWLERCLHNKAFMEPKEHVIGRPFKRFPVPGFDRLIISTSGFIKVDLMLVTKAIKLLGATYSEDTTSRTSVIVCRALNQVRADKYKFAQRLEIPIVRAEWLWESIDAGTRLSFQTYQARQPKSPNLPLDAEGTRITAQDEPQSGSSLTTHVKKLPKLASPPSEELSKHAQDTALDVTACADNRALPEEKPEWNTAVKAVKAPNSNAQDLLSKPEPLTDRNLNSSSNTVSTAPAPSDHPQRRGDYDHEAISDFLAKTKTAKEQSTAMEMPRAGRRGSKRILGRVASNMSNGSAGYSRAASIESTTHGVFFEDDKEGIDKASSCNTDERIEMLMKGAGQDVETQPPATQLQYDDPESKEAEEMARARMLGDRAVGKKATMKSRTLTIHDLENFEDKPRARRTRAGR